jgi:hypothetical protein
VDDKIIFTAGEVKVLLPHPAPSSCHFVDIPNKKVLLFGTLQKAF